MKFAFLTHARANALALLSLCAAVVFMADPARAQLVPTIPTDVTSGNAHLSSSGALFDIGSQFLRKLGNEAAGNYVGPPHVNNPLGGGADSSQDTRYRSWFEGYGVAARMSGEGDFAGDKRRAWGGVAGIGMNLTPGISAGLSVDQSHTKIDVASLPQNATIDLTQIGGNLAFESGQWTFGVAGIYGFGRVNTRRDDIGGTSSADYNAKLWGAIAEISYLYEFGQSRIVPKAGFDFTHTQTQAFTEIGGPAPVMGSTQTSSRSRAFAGAEVGHTWIVGGKMFDLSGYGRVIDIMTQDIGDLNITGATATTLPQSIQGIGESSTGLDAGAAASLRLSALARLYAVYDGRFRSNFRSHTGTLGLELRW